MDFSEAYYAETWDNVLAIFLNCQLPQTPSEKAMASAKLCDFIADHLEHPTAESQQIFNRIAQAVGPAWQPNQ